MSKVKSGITRRDMLSVAVPSAAALLLPGAGKSEVASSTSPQTFLSLPVLAQPDLVFAYVGESEAERYKLSRAGNSWTADGQAAGLRVEFHSGESKSSISLESPKLPVQRINLRWKHRLPNGVLALGDAWERSYGDLEWKPLQAERSLPWYAMLHAKDHTVGMGVMTGAASFAFWQVDSVGISLWLDVRNGGNGVQLGARILEMATIVTYIGMPGETTFAATQRLCYAMASSSKIASKRGASPTATIYGSNDWYYAYGQNTHDGILRDADLVASVAPAGAVRPFTVIDDGYQDRSRFPSMSKLAAEIRRREVIPGVWIRPLRAPSNTAPNLLLPAARCSGPSSEAPLAYDVTIPEALEAAAAVAAEACDWGFDLIKHDFTTFELFGQWGSQMGASPTQGSWHFNDRTVTNAEIVTALYQRLRKSCGEDRIILGCDTVGHLSVGIFDASRTGDDVSGKAWERTRRMGVNTLGFRMAQHRAFFSIDADCVALTPEVPWSQTAQWLEVVARSGSVLLISPDPRAVGSEEKAALRDAFAQCARGAGSEPMDWVENRTPELWRSSTGKTTYRWTMEEGESPFPI